MSTAPRRLAPITVVLLLAVGWGTALIAMAVCWHLPGTTVVGMTTTGAHYTLRSPDRTVLQQDGLVGVVAASIPLLASLVVAWCLRWSPPACEGILLAVAWVLTGALSLLSLLAAFAFGPLLMPTAALLVAACSLAHRGAGPASAALGRTP